MKILFVTSNRLGDAVLSTGLLDHLIRTYPDGRITVVCGPVAGGVFTRMPNRDRIIVLRKQKWGLHWLPLWARTATRIWDLVVDIRGSALSWLVPTRRRAVFRRRNGPKIAQLGAILDLSPPPLPVVWTAQADRDRTAILLETEQTNHCPGADGELAAESLAGRPVRGGLPVLVGVRISQRPACHPWRSRCSRTLPWPRHCWSRCPRHSDLVGALSLPEAAAVLQQASLFIGNNSGLMHLAAAAGAPTIGLFGPTDANTYGPAGPLATAVVGVSMDAITVAQVVEAGERLGARLSDAKNGS